MRVDFYLLGKNKALQQVVYSLIGKGYQEGWRIGVHSEDDAFITELNEKLWVQNANSFLPHSTITTTRCQSCEEPIMLFKHAPDDIDTLDYLINCTGIKSHYNNSNGRIADIIKPDEASKISGRSRYSEYKQQQCELNYHEIK